MWESESELFRLGLIQEGMVRVCGNTSSNGVKEAISS